MSRLRSTSSEGTSASASASTACLGRVSIMMIIEVEVFENVIVMKQIKNNKKPRFLVH
jgi:hypothetical protein